MKKTYLLTAVLFLSICSIKAQDTIVFRDGSELLVKILEVYQSKLKYKLFNNVDGPVFIKSTNDIFMVKYHGGHKEVYTEIRDRNGLELSRGELYYNGQKINDDQIIELIGLDSYKTYKTARNQRIFGGVTVGVGFATLGAGLLLPIINGDFYRDYELPLILTGSGLIIGGIGLGIRNIGRKRLDWIVNDFNSKSVSDNYSLTISPILAKCPDGNNGTLCYGVGVSLNL